MLQLLCILGALIIGYSFKELPLKMAFLNKTLTIFITLILLVLGYNLGSDPLFLKQILFTFKIVITFSIAIFLINFICMTIYSKIFKLKINHLSERDSLPQKSKLYFFSSCKYLGYIILGVIAGYFMHIKITHLEFIINAVLLIVLFIIGFQLRQQNISLKTVLINKTGIKIAILTILSALLAGIIAAAILGLNIRIGLALSSGLGWYTLSGIIVGQLINAHIGAAVFFIDFFREVIAILIIPIFSRINPTFCVSYSASTALDFTLPILKAHLKEEIVSAAITSGLILTTVVPILTPLCCRLVSMAHLVS